MGDAASEFLVAARGFRAAFAGRRDDDAASARRVRNAVARVYLAAVFLPSHTAAHVESGSSTAVATEHALTAIDAALADSIAWLEADAPGAVWRARFAFETRWGSHALDVLRPLHELARHAAA